jgi:glycerophosphoryl diester phosphodiesterase
MIVIAHRGANKEAYENSWSAFEKAIEAGADRLELDVQITKDHEAIICHDPDLKRMGVADRSISELTRKECEALKLPNGEPMPFLDQVIERLLPQVELNIEIKPDTALAAQIVARALEGSPHAGKVIISSFQPTPLIYLGRHHPELTLACLWGSFQNRHPLAFLMPFYFMKRCHARILHPETRLVSKALVSFCHARGWKVFPYVTMKGEDDNKVALWQKMKAAGVDGLCSNYPREFKKWLQQS